MEITQIEYGIEVTINTGNFQNVKPMYKALATIHTSEDPVEAYAALKKLVNDRIEAAVKKVLAAGLRTPDIYEEGTTRVGTREMGDAVLAVL